MPLIRPGIRKLLHLALRRSDRSVRDVDEEIASHLALRAQQFEARGMTPQAARAEALRRFGPPSSARRHLMHAATYRERRMSVLEKLTTIRHDVAYAIRQLRRSPGFTVAAVALLAIGIGANATMFGVVDRLFLQPPPGIADAGRVKTINLHHRSSVFGEYIASSFSYPFFTELRSGATAFDHLTAWFGPRPLALGRGTQAQQVQGTAVSADYFTTFGVRPARGRFFATNEVAEPVGKRVAVISYGYWQSAFGGAADVVGKPLDLGGSPFTIIGVAAKDFSGATLNATDVWVPVTAAQGLFPFIRPGTLASRGSLWIRIVGHLRPGASPALAAAQVTTLRRADARQPGGGGDTTGVAVLGSLVPGQAPTLRPQPANQVAKLVFAVSILVLLIACANLANLLLARALRRQREIAVRLALGVSRARLIRLLLAESMTLAALGGAAALAVAWFGERLVSAVLYVNRTPLDSGVDGRLVAFTAAIAVVTGLVTGLIPAVRMSRADLTGALKQGPREGAQRSHARTALLLTQGALTALLLVGTGLFVRSLQQINNLNLGFDLDHVMYVDVNVDGMGYTAPERAAVFNRLLADAQAMPGVASAALTVGSPFNNSYAVSFSIPGRKKLPELPDGGPYIYSVSPSFFRTMGTRIVQGRDFTEADLGDHRVAIVNETMARVYWPGTSPLGQCLVVDTAKDCTEVVGVAASSRRQRVVADTTLQFFVPITHAPSYYADERMLIVRSVADASAAADAIRRQLQRAEPNLPYVSVQSMAQIVAPQLRSWRLGARMFGLFGVLALLLGTLGAYSVLSYSVAQRTHEMGVRMALGARVADVVRLIVRQALAVSALSIVVGLALALAGGRFVRDLLFKVSPHDPAVFVGVGVVLLLTALLASVIPAMRASRTDPMAALRTE
ncbi:MAG TPA: ADOP family duplicated permease [Gemmatimonadaceae bacterium]|nr:ADOP family duplicated permease [Gemmatimonadaceae bacterium]